MASTSVVLPWSTWAMMAMLRIFWLMCGVAVNWPLRRSNQLRAEAKTKIAAGEQPAARTNLLILRCGRASYSLSDAANCGQRGCILLCAKIERYRLLANGEEC